MNVNLTDLLGPDEAAFAAQQIAAAKDEAAKAVLGTIKSHKEVWQAKPEKERKKLAGKAHALALRQTGHVVACPACSCDALLFGNPLAAPKKTLEEDLVIETQTKVPSQFQCFACGLKNQRPLPAIDCRKSETKLSSSHDPSCILVCQGHWHAGRRRCGKGNRAREISFSENRA
jgi:hypothetical protein